MATEEVLARLERVEAQLEIQQLAVRYAQAIDARDLDAWLTCFRPDVDMGRAGTGREVLRSRIEPLARTFRRSVHHITGHRIEPVSSDRARGAVYCRAEHEVGDRWITMSICYFDDYVRLDGRWYFSRRRERHWYSADVPDRPQDVDYTAWSQAGRPDLPEAFPSWEPFWAADPATAAAPGDEPTGVDEPIDARPGDRSTS
ncbi:nuclear transport factor 2 family protein [Kitasatospora sp. NPDC101235]|uniref:nuclear transport factor 2 family protein n=1 Tax=Kitasatospora sp. NPDC101235 TaxID=3364101 RepID=UPI0038044037